MKKVIVIGAGIAGLTCGIYLKRSGFDVEIYESNHMAGGECTGWDRGGYHFDGCIHWLVNSKSGTALYQTWRDTGAIDDSVRFIHYDIYGTYEEDGAVVHLYTDADKLEKHLLELAPEDRKEIVRLCGAIRALGNFGMPMEKPMDMMTAGDGIKFALKSARKMSKMSMYSKLTMQEFAALFKSKLLQRAFLSAVPAHYTCLALVTTLAQMHAGDSGFPEGGSRALAERMEKRFLELGGRAFYKAKVERILVKDGKATGIRLADGREAYADHIVSCADGYATLKHMLEDKYTPEMYNNLFAQPKKYRTVTSALVFMGVGAEIPYTCRALSIRREAPDSVSGARNGYDYIMNYSFDKSMAPAGKTVMGCYYFADFDYWNALYADKEKYKAAKKKLEEDAVAAVVRRFPEAEGKIEVTDVVTPMTYARYCNAWRGSWMTWVMPEKGVPRYFPGVLPGLNNFVMAGMWTMPPGGLPAAAASGRFAAQRLCMRYGVKFEV